WGVADASQATDLGRPAMILPAPLAAVLLPQAPGFTTPTIDRFALLAVSALPTTGRRTVANLLRTLRGFAPGHCTAYQPALSRATWSGLDLGCALAAFVLQHLLPAGPVVLVGDDTVDGHKGKRVYDKARHRDPVRTTKSYTAWWYGHKWVVLAVLVRFPFATRPWALPVLIDLYRSAEDDRQRKRPHRTPAQLMCRLLRLLLLRFPGRASLFVGKAPTGTQEGARSCHHPRARLTRVSKRHPDANLYEPPPPYTGKGRPRVKGAPLPKPRQAAGKGQPRRL